MKLSPKPQYSDPKVMEESLLNDSGETEEQQPTVVGSTDVEDVEIEEVLTPSGRQAIAFVSPVSNNKVIILNPTTQDILSIERVLMKKHRDAGQFEQSIVMMSRLIVGYGDLLGENILSFERIIRTFERSEVTLIASIMGKLFS